MGHDRGQHHDGERDREQGGRIGRTNAATSAPSPRDPGRLDWARAKLRWNRSLADVALTAGFADQAHLSRMFKYAFGVTPARYRALEANRTP